MCDVPPKTMTIDVRSRLAPFYKSNECNELGFATDDDMRVDEFPAVLSPSLANEGDGLLRSCFGDRWCVGVKGCGMSY